MLGDTAYVWVKEEDVKDLSPNELNGYLQAVALQSSKNQVTFTDQALVILKIRQKFIRKDVALLILPNLFYSIETATLTGFNLRGEPVIKTRSSSKAIRFFESISGFGNHAYGSDDD